MLKHKINIISLLICLVCNLLFATDWPEFRGAGRTGFSLETDLLDSWPEGGPELVWSVEGVLGIGWSSACVVDNIVYIAGMDKDTKIGSIFAFDKDGNQLWRTEYGSEWSKSFPGTRNTPTYSDDRIYINSGLRTLSCLDAKTGKLLWQVDAAAKYKVTKEGRWGGSDSALVCNDNVIIISGGTLGSVAAFNKATGDEAWVTEDLTEESVHCSPVLIDHNGKKIVIAVLAESMAGIDPVNGNILWKVAHSDYEQPGGRPSGARANCPIYESSKIFLTCGYDKGAGMFELSPDGNEIKILGSVYDFDTHMGGVVKVGDYVYGTNTIRGGNEWVSLNWNTGEFGYRHSWEGSKGSLIAAEDKLYCYNEQLGVVALVKAEPDKFEIISQFVVGKGSGEHWAHLAISNGRLYVHRGDSLFVYKITKHGL